MNQNFHQLVQKKLQELVTTALEYFKEEVMMCHEFPKNTILLNEGEVSKYLFIIKKGSLRNFVFDANRNENTTWFAFDNELTMAPLSFLMQIPSLEIIQTMETSEIYFLSFESLNKLMQMDLKTNQILRELLEIPVILMSIRMYSLQNKFAEERYRDLLNDHPHIIQRVPLSYIASYLGISLETLSRIRKKK